MDEARTVIRRLERIEALQSSRAPAGALLAEVRQLLREGEAWLVAEHEHDGGARTARASGAATHEAEAALEGCRRSLASVGEVRPGSAATTTL